MENNSLKTPLKQSALLLGGVILVLLIASSSGGNGGGVFAALAGVGNTILYLIGMAIALSVSIAVMIGIFLGGVAMNSPEQAKLLYADLKKTLAQTY